MADITTVAPEFLMASACWVRSVATAELVMGSPTTEQPLYCPISRLTTEATVVPKAVWTVLRAIFWSFTFICFLRSVQMYCRILE